MRLYTEGRGRKTVSGEDWKSYSEDIERFGKESDIILEEYWQWASPGYTCVEGRGEDECKLLLLLMGGVSGRTKMEVDGVWTCLEGVWRRVLQGSESARKFMLTGWL